jgi:hypothetical protein
MKGFEMVEPMTQKRFSKIIEDIVREKNLTYMDAVLHYCAENELEPEDVRKFIGKTLKERIALNAQDLNYLPKTTEELPV